MIYSNPEFLVLLILLLGAYALARTHEVRFWILLAGSLIFYAWSSLLDTLIFFLVVVVSWSAVALSRRFPQRKSLLIAAGVTVMAGHLLFWKYAPWVVGQFQIVAPSFWGGRDLLLPLPLGISFFTLQGIAYLVDYSREEASFMDFPTYLLFKSFFAQLIAGPLVRSRQLTPQLDSLPRPRPEDYSIGLAQFARGFFKKMAVADLVAGGVDEVFRNPAAFGRATLVAAVLGYAVQVWADFSAYTDMGRGAARMFGVRLPESFLSPYLSRTPSEFWKRWNVTLAEWIRDYLYIPLGGSRGGTLRALGVVAVTMGACGLWHGAEWHFIVWGLYQGALLIVERKLGWGAPDSGRAGKIRIALQTLSTFGAVAFGCLIFRCVSLGAAADYLKALWSGTGGSALSPMQAIGAASGFAYCALEQALFYRELDGGKLVFLSSARERLRQGAGAFGVGAAAGVAFAAAVLLRSAGSSRTFIYFRF